MNTLRERIDSRAATPSLSPAGFDVPAGFDGLRSAFSDLYGQTANTRQVFGSPLGPVQHGAHAYWLPRFVYFGSDFSDASVRLAVYAGFDGTEVRPTLAVLSLVQRLILRPDLGQGISLSLFPCVNPSGFEAGTRLTRGAVDLGATHWNESAAPEIVALANDVRLRAYHGFVRVEAAPVDEIQATLRSGSRACRAGDAVLVPPTTVESPMFPIRWSWAEPLCAPEVGPLSIADDLLGGPFELVLRVPDSWSEALFGEAVVHVLRRFVVHYRASYAYGIHL